jgi:two-component system, OmpR family, alkaline phosphatase synthesis response regulator PhoP
MANQTILLVEDDADIRELVRYNMEREGYKVVASASAEQAKAALAKKTPDLILLDLMLPGMDGFSFCRELRKDERTAKTPVIMVTARVEDADIVAGLEVGADDYVTKPFSARVLVARVKTALRRREFEPEDASNILVRGPFEIDRAHHVAKVKAKPVVLTIGEFKALDLFMRRPGVVFSRYQIVDAIHGGEHASTDRAVDVLIVGLRKKLGACSDWIETIRGVGYCMRMP